MIRAIFVALLLVAAGTAWAQPMEEVVAPDTVELRVKESRTFSFDRPVTQIRLSAKGVAEVVPESDRLVTMTGLTQGKTLMTAYGADGRIVYRANIDVLQAGGLVRIYGTERRGRDFVGFFCNATTCGRANTDVPPTAFSTTVTETQTGPDGTPQTISREYR